MNSEGYKRKLSAVFSADVAGYSRLMGEDESFTVKTLTTYRNIMASLIKQHRGRIVDSPGDNILAEFASVVDATQCAVAIQKELQSRNAALAEDHRMVFRIGINLGDVIEEDDRIYGDGVNVAARLEALADPGGICISKTAFDHIESKLPLGYELIGEQIVKNIAKPVIAYKVLMDPRVTTAGHRKGRPGMPPWFGKAVGMAVATLLVFWMAFGIWNFFVGGRITEPAPGGIISIVVLPFTNLSDDPEQEFFSDGITEEIISALAKVKGLSVSSSTTAFSYKGKDLDIRSIGKSLKVGKVLEGSVRKAGNKLRITAQLINVADDSHLWSETYDRDMVDVFKLQNEIAQSIVNSLKERLLRVDEEILDQDYVRRLNVDTIVTAGETIEGGLSAFGANIDIAGTVSGGLETFGANISVSGRNQGDLKFVGANVALAGDFLQTVSGLAANITISGVFEGDVEVTAARVVIEPTAVIKGDFVYATALLERKEGSQMLGQAIPLNSAEGKVWSKNRPGRPHQKPEYVSRTILWIVFTLSLLIVGWLANHLLPDLTEAAVSTLSGSFWKNLGSGVLFLIATPLCVAICLFTVIGLPVGILLLFLFITTIYISRVYAGLWVGRKLLGYMNDAHSAGFFRPFAAGIVVIGLLLQVPVLGWILRAVLLFIGAGALARMLWNFAFRKS